MAAKWRLGALVLPSIVAANLACAVPVVIFGTGDTDAKMAMASRPGSIGKFEIEAADDFVLTQSMSISGASFTSLLVGGPVGDLVKASNDQDLLQGVRQPTDHGDWDGNLRVAPGNGMSYREYTVPDTDLPKPAYARLAPDRAHRRLSITPTHYDLWIQDRKVAE